MLIIKQKKSVPAFSLVEVILSIAFLAIIITALTMAISLGEQASQLSGARMRATLLAEEGLEAVRNMRDDNFSNLSDGTYGLAVNSNQWTFSGTQDTNGIFTRQIAISTVDSNTKNIVSTVTWQQNPERTGTISLSTRLTNWKYITKQSYELGLNVSNAIMGGPSKFKICGLVLTNNGAFDVTITQMRLDWSPNQNLKGIYFHDAAVWTGSASKGQTVDIQDFVIHGGQSEAIDHIDFDGNMLNTDYFTVTFIMSDGSVSSPKFIINNADKNAC